MSLFHCHSIWRTVGGVKKKEEEGKRRRKVKKMWSFYYQQSSPGFHRQLVSKLPPSQAWREYNFSQSPSSLGVQKAIVGQQNGHKRATGPLIKICIGNARTAISAIFASLHSAGTHLQLWPLFVPLALKVMDSIFVQYNCKGQGVCRNWLIPWANNALPWILYCLSGHAAQGFVCSLQLSLAAPNRAFSSIWKASSHFGGICCDTSLVSKPKARAESKDKYYTWMHYIFSIKHVWF